MSKLSKSTVDLEGDDVRVSKIRRDPAAVAPAKKAVTYRDDNEKRTVLLGIAFFSVALFIIFLNLSDYTNDYFN